jgi:hypothetical protein
MMRNIDLQIILILILFLIGATVLDLGISFQALMKIFN